MSEEKNHILRHIHLHLDEDAPSTAPIPSSEFEKLEVGNDNPNNAFNEKASDGIRTHNLPLTKRPLYH